VRLDERALREEHPALERVLERAHVAGPREGVHRVGHRGGQLRWLRRARFRQHRVAQAAEVAALAQRRQLHGEAVDPEVEVAAEEAARDRGAQVVVIDPVRTPTAAHADWHLQVAPGSDAALALGMRVIGFDPQITVERAWELSSGVEKARSLDELFSRADVISLHVPLLEATRGLVNEARIRLMPGNGVLLNFSRGEIVEESAVLAALAAGKLTAYVCDFPSRRLMGSERVIALPHLGASTEEAEVNCAVMVADTVRGYLENGLIRHSVNFPDADLPRMDAHRVTVANANVPNMVGQISGCLGDAGLNIADLLNKSRGNLAYTIVDLDGAPSAGVLAKIRGIEGVLCVRDLGRPQAA